MYRNLQSILRRKHIWEKWLSLLYKGDSTNIFNKIRLLQDKLFEEILAYPICQKAYTKENNIHVLSLKIRTTKY